jgi:hypothetical protein
MILAFALQNPQATGAAVNSYSKPGEISPERMESSAADFARETLQCYHRTARFRGVEILGSPWQEQGKYSAENSVVMRVNFTGMTGMGYQMIFAAMTKGRNYRTAVIAENSTIPYNKNCALEYWVSAGN